MNELFAIEPTAFDDHKDLKYLLSKFGFHEGRFIAEYPGKWLKLVYAHLDNLPDIERSRAAVLLQSHKEDLMILRGSPWIEKYDWVQNATILKQDQKVTDVIVARSHAGEFQSPDDVDDSYFYEIGSGRQSKVMSNAEGYASVASMMLRLSHEVAIIDPYIFKNKYPIGWKRVAESFAVIAKIGKCKRFIVFTFADSESTTYSTLETWANLYLSDVFALGVSVSIYLLLDVGKEDADDHGRYLVSAKGAMYFDKGFVEERVPRLRSVGFIDKSMHTELYSQYFEGEDALPFRIMHSFHSGAKPLAGAL